MTDKLWTILDRLGTIAGIVGLILSVWALVQVGEVTDLVERAAQWRRLELTLSEPANGSQLKTHLVDVRGTISYEPFREPPVSSVRLQLASSQIEVVSMVRPIAEPLRWWPQPEPAIADDGGFNATVRVGRPAPETDGGRYEIIVLAVPRGSISRTDTYEVLPAHYAESPILRVSRQ
jgi:hypothetical protein